ncbi:MAG: hypothetical protein JSV51_08655 [Candidatus Bathyarchaeota archaeon]|nr:MAG: hypothetical protein JSV51_08655 [Candidatus Bathyarchaeota archaeon]
MRTEQAIALIALMLGIIGGLLLASGGFRILLALLEGNQSFEPRTLLIASIGVIAVVASVVIWTGRYVVGGSLNIILGVLMVFIGEAQQGIIILVSGILGIVAPKIRD